MLGDPPTRNRIAASVARTPSANPIRDTTVIENMPDTSDGQKGDLRSSGSPSRRRSENTATPF